MNERSSHSSLPQLPGGSSFAKRQSTGGSSASRARPPGSDGQQTVISGRVPTPGVPLTRSEPPLETGALLEGEQLGQFLLEKFVGGGGMGVVFRALDTTLNREVAVKVLSRDQSTDEETLRRFRNEAQSAARLNHENIAHVHYVGEDRGLHYIVFEFIEGVNIRDLVEQKGPLPLDEALSYTYQIALALEHASSRAVIHRDIKPSNVLIASDGKAKLVDMGLARLNQVAHNDDLTASGVTLGTFDYISPEQARDPRSADVRSDLYSLGCSFFYMLTGRPPFPEGTVLQKLLQHQGDHPPDPRAQRPELPAEVTHILGRLLAKNPAQRYQSAGQLIDELAALGEKLGMQLSSSRTPLVLPPSRSPMASWQHHLPWALPLAALFLIVTGLDFYWSASQREPVTAANKAAARAPVADGRAAPKAAPATTPVESADPVTLPSDTDASEADRAVDDPTSPLPDPANEPAGQDAAEGTAPFDARRPLFQNLFGPFGEQLDLERWKHRVASAARKPQQDGERDGTDSGTSPDAPAALPGSAAPAQENLLIVSDLPGPRSYSSLYAACAAAKSGEVIELRFDGERIERPLSISNVKLTIRAGQGNRPVVVFRPEPDQVPLKYPPTMLSVAGGQLHVSAVQFEFEVPRDLPTDWALFELRRAELVYFTDCVFTVRNTSVGQTSFHSGVAFFDVKAAPGTGGMSMDNEPLDEQVRTIHLKNCLARGEAVFLRDNDLQPIRLIWDNGLLATSERLLEANGGTSQPRPTGHIQIQLRHFTAMTQSGLALLINSQDAPYQLLTDISCEDSILVSKAGPPLVEQRGTEPVEAYQARLQWNGRRNYFDGYEIFWAIADRMGGAASKLMRFDDWQDFWRGQSRQQVAGSGAVVWQALPESNRPYHTHLPADYALDATAGGNAALGGGSDGADAGCRLKLLPAVYIGQRMPASTSGMPPDNSGAP